MKIKPLYLMLFLCLCGCNFLDMGSGGDKSPDKPEPEKKETKVSESEVWKKLAEHVRAGTPTRTDDIVLAVDNLKRVGDISDDKRIESLRKKAQEITDENRESIARMLE